MAPKTAQNRVAVLEREGASLDEARAQLKTAGYSKSRVSQLLQGYGGGRIKLLMEAFEFLMHSYPDVVCHEWRCLDF